MTRKHIQRHSCKGNKHQNRTGIALHTYWGGYFEKIASVEEEGEKLKPYALLLGAQNDAASVESSLTVPG